MRLDHLLSKENRGSDERVLREVNDRVLLEMLSLDLNNPMVDAIEILLKDFFTVYFSTIIG